MKPAVRIILGVVIVLAIAGGAFYGGTVYGKSQATAGFTARRASGFATGQNGQAATGQARSGSMLFGQIKTVKDDGLVVTDSSGNEINVKVVDTTLIEKNMSVKVTDLAEGETVIISGQKADDGTITARSLQVAPAGRFNVEGGPQPVGQGGQGQGNFPGGGAFPQGGGGAPPAP